MKKKRRLKPKIKILITFIIAIILFGYLSFSAINYGILKNKYENEEKNLKNKLNSLKTKEEDLNKEINKLKDDDYLARYAREEYLYSKDGEYVIKIEEKEEKNDVEEKKENHFLTYIVIICTISIFLAVLIFFIKFKKSKKDISK